MASARRVSVHSGIGGGKFTVHSVAVSEALGRPFEMRIELESREGGLALDDMLGQEVTVELAIDSGGPRYWHGLVAAVRQLSYLQAWAYELRVVPWLWMLSRRSDVRIFQDQSVPEIVKKVFADAKFADFEDALQGSYPKREYCVQYRETDLNFVQRLLEEEGAYYFFKHERSRHVLVLADALGSHAAYPGTKKTPYFASGTGATWAEAHVSEWQIARDLTAGKYVHQDFFFAQPSADLAANEVKPAKHPHGALAMYDYPGRYVALAAGDQVPGQSPEDISRQGSRLAKVRLEELQAQRARVAGQGQLPGVATGYLFTLGGDGKSGDHPRADQNREYLVLGTHFLMTPPGESSGAGSGGTEELSVTFDALPSDMAFRPARVTPKPIVQGPQTAVVVGPAGDDINTDKFGRIKVQFPWDRVGARNEKSSCWVRVAQAWAGAGYGAYFLPRIGHEVLVAFLEGDPDQPLVVGSVYNGENKTPFLLPDEKTRSGIRTRSANGGDGGTRNELVFDDKKGQELFLVHAEKDLTVEVENNEDHHTQKDRKVAVDGEDSEKVGKSQKVDIGKDQTITVGAKFALTATDEITLTTGQSKIVMKSDGTITISGMKISIQATDTLSGQGAQIKFDGDAKFNVSAPMIGASGQNVSVSGTMLSLSGSGTATLSGGMIMIG